MSDSNKKRVPQRVIAFSEGEARHDGGRLNAPDVQSSAEPDRTE
jgi:hypothetical protein